MNTELKLRINKEIIDQIKLYAMRHQKSLSDLTEDIYKELLNIEKESGEALSPIVKKYKGILKSKNIDEYNDKVDYLNISDC